MKRGKFVSVFFTPLFLVLSIVMLIMAVASLWWNKIIFSVELIASLASIAVVIVGTVNLQKYLKKVSDSTLRSLEGSDAGSISRINVAAVILGENNEIIAANSMFEKIIGEDDNPIGKSIEEYLINRNLITLFEDNGTDTILAEKWFVAFGVRAGKGSVVYFVDNNEYKRNSDEYIETRPVVAIVAFDNREEIERDNLSKEL